MKKLCSGFLCLLLIWGTTASQCPLSDHQKSQLLSDSLSLEAQNNGGSTNAQNLIYNYVYEESFSSTPNVAIGLNQIQASQSPYLEIYLNAPKISQEGIYFQAKSGNESKWKNFKINFFASTRNDLEIGSVEVSNPQTNRDGEFELAYQLDSHFNSTGLKVKSFMQGISAESINKQQIGLKHSNVNVHGQTLYFSFANVQRASIIRFLSISVIVFNIYTPGVLYADGIIDQNYVASETKITIPKHGINELRTYIVGINSFETSAAQPISIASAIDETFTLIIGPIDRTTIDFISVSYLILSIIDCGSCSGFPLLFDGLCRPSCPPQTRQKNGRCIPIDCSEGFVLGPDRVCIPKCKDNEVYDGKTCVCLEGFYLIKGTCQQCLVSEYFDYKDVICKPLCTFNSYYLDGRCYCNDGYFIINGLCQKCPYGSVYSNADQRCYNLCSEYEVFSPQGCVCENGYVRISGVCGRCPYQRIYDPISETCGCLPGYEPVYGECKPLCPQNQIRVDGTCICESGFNRVLGSCIQCPQHSYYNPIKKECFCQRPYMLMNGVCVPACPRNYYVKDNQCVPYCQQYVEEYINGECVCHHEYQRSSNGICVAKCLQFEIRNTRGDCECIPGYFKSPYSLCSPISCPPGTFWNATRKDCISFCKALEVFINGKCVCKEGFKNDNGYGDCTPECSSMQVRKNGYCVCPPNHKTVDNGICIPDCPPGSYLVNGECQCLKNCYNGPSKYCGFGQDYDPLTGNCKCLKPKIWMMGQCMNMNFCGENQYWCGTMCKCNYGFYEVNGKCVRVGLPRTCPSNSVSNGVNCLCNQGFYPVRPGSCSRCPSFTYWDGKKCAEGEFECFPGYKWDQQLLGCVLAIPLCNPNEQWDGANCRCKQGYFFINGACRACEYGTVFDGVSCVAGSGHQCTDPYSFWNGERCVCIPGFFPLWSDRCITCPAGTHWDGTCCKFDGYQSLPWTV